MPTKRFVEIDLLRASAIVMMVIYHIVFIEWYLFGVDINVMTGPWKVWQQITAHLFILLVGISFVLSWSRRPSVWHQWKRGLTVFCWGMMITLMTWAIFPDAYIRFGILHCIGVSVVLLPFFMPLQKWNMGIGFLLALCGPLVQLIHTDMIVLLPFGFYAVTFTSLDYFPLIPWFGVALIGAGLGHGIYGQQEHEPVQVGAVLSALSWPGKHALKIYLIHVPVIFLFLSILHASV